MDPLEAEPAIDLIRDCARRGQIVLGVDGLELSSSGYIGRLDLILDLTTANAHKHRTPASLACEAETFIRERQAANIVWDAVIAAA